MTETVTKQRRILLVAAAVIVTLRLLEDRVFRDPARTIARVAGGAL